MTRRRRHIVRAEALAPWLTMAVILSLWWIGAHLLGRDAVPGPPGMTADLTTAIDAGPLDTFATPAASASEAGDAGVVRDPVDLIARASENRSEAAEGGTVLLVPVSGIDALSLRSSFDEPRGGGGRRHEAMDILAPRGTPVVAAVEGRIVKLFTSAAGGLTIYQFDREERFSYYYAHLDAYAPDLNEGEDVARGQILGYVGTTGNAPADTPHLHFAVFRLGPDKKWWEGEAIDPFDLLR